MKIDDNTTCGGSLLEREICENLGKFVIQAERVLRKK